MSKEQNTVFWVVTGLLAFTFVAAGLPKVLGARVWLFRFMVWGYPYWFLLLVGALELAGAGLLLYRRTTFFGASLLSLIMLGAFVTHFMKRDGIAMLGPVVVLVLLWYVLKKTKPRSLRFRKPHGSSN